MFDLDMSNVDQSRIYELRGQGMSNFAIGFIRDNQRFVWRIRKFRHDRKEKKVASSDDCELSIRFTKEFVSPLVPGASKFIISPKMVALETQTLRDIENQLGVSSISNFGRVFALEMPDFTVFPHESSLSANNSNFPVIGVEIKPKEGFIPSDLIDLAKITFDQDVAYCSNCLSQYEKSLTSVDERKFYDYCPLDLFSGDERRMRRALSSLIDCPLNHLRVTRDGKIVMDKSRRLTHEEISSLLGNEQVDCDFIDLIIRILLWSGGRVEMEASGLPKGCILDAIVQAQKSDRLGPLQTAACIDEIIATTRIIVDHADRFSLFFGDFESIASDQLRSKMDLVRSGVVCHTLRDCSIMITMQVFESQSDGVDLGCSFRLIHIDGRFWLRFNLSIIDLDAKSPAKLIIFGRRMKKALSLLWSESKNGVHIRVPCNLRGST